MNNLKKVLFLFAFLGLFSAVQAQIGIGPKVGINIATLGGDDVGDDDGLGSIVGLQFGAAAEIGINEMFAVQPELLFFQKGAKQEFEILGETFEAEQFLNYFEIPILLKIMFGDSEGTQFFASVGPSFGFGLGGKAKSGGEEEDIDFEESGLSKLDIGASVGAGVQLPAGPGNLFIDVRYLLGLTTLDDEGDFDMKNRGIGIAAGFLFPISGE